LRWYDLHLWAEFLTKKTTYVFLLSKRTTSKKKLIKKRRGGTCGSRHVAPAAVDGGGTSTAHRELMARDGGSGPCRRRSRRQEDVEHAASARGGTSGDVPTLHWRALIPRRVGKFVDDASGRETDCSALPSRRGICFLGNQCKGFRLIPGWLSVECGGFCFERESLQSHKYQAISV
jgi:hypothetical protein